MAGSARRPGASPNDGEGFVDNGPGWPATSFSLKPSAHLVRIRRLFAAWAEIVAVRLAA